MADNNNSAKRARSDSHYEEDSKSPEDLQFQWISPVLSLHNSYVDSTLKKLKQHFLEDKRDPFGSLCLTTAIYTVDISHYLQGKEIPPDIFTQRLLPHLFPLGIRSLPSRPLTLDITQYKAQKLLNSKYFQDLIQKKDSMKSYSLIEILESSRDDGEILFDFNKFIASLQFLKFDSEEEGLEHCKILLESVGIDLKEVDAGITMSWKRGDVTLSCPFVPQQDSMRFKRKIINTE